MTQMILSPFSENITADGSNNLDSANPTGAGGAPLAPTGFTSVYLSDTSLSLAWTDNATNELNYELDRSLTGTGSWTALADPAANATTATSTGLTVDTQYFYRLRAVNAAGNSSYATANGTTTASTFQLAASNYVVSDLTMEIAAPRPDVERSANSRYDFASTEFEYEVPITVKGGSYPFKYEITARSGTANVATATIGETRTYGVGREWLGSANQKDYGVIRWTPLSGDDTKTFSFTVRVTDQAANTATVTYTGVVEDSKFIFVQDGVVSGTGTLASPFEDCIDFWPNEADSTYSDKFVVFRAGNYSAFASSTITSSKPRAYLAFPGDAQPVFDGTAKDYLFQSAGIDDWWWSGIRVNGTPTGPANVRFFEAGTSTSSFDRAMFWNNYFFDGKFGTTGNDNAAWIMCMDNGLVVWEYMSVVGNTFDTTNASSNGFRCASYFNAQKFVIENNIVKNTRGESVFEPKDDCSDFSIRSNDIWENNEAGNASIYIPNQPTDNPTLDTADQEVCWNFINDASGDCVNWAGRTDNPNAGPFYLYRNTMLTPFKASVLLAPWVDATPAEVIQLTKNVHVSGSDPYLASDLDVNGSTDAEMAAFWTTGTFDSTYYAQATQTEVNTTTGKLQNSGLSVLGTYGAEVSA